MAQRRRIHSLGNFHQEATRRGLTYAQAQIEETCDIIGLVRIPKVPRAERVYKKVSTWNMLRKQAGSK